MNPFAGYLRVEIPVCRSQRKSLSAHVVGIFKGAMKLDTQWVNESGLMCLRANGHPMLYCLYLKWDRSSFRCASHKQICEREMVSPL